MIKCDLKTINFLLFLFLFDSIKCWKCGADQLKLKPAAIHPLKEEKRKLSYSYYTPIRIKVDYSNLRTSNLIDSTTLTKIVNLIEETCAEFSRFIKVQHLSATLSGSETLIKEHCEINSIGEGFENYLIENDIIIFPAFDSTLGVSTLAAAALCLYSSSNLRPYAGVLLINPELSFTKRNTEIYMKNLILHELTHVLIFNPELMSAIGMTTTKIFEGYFVTFINSPKVLTAARKHFNCITINGVPLENQGGTGSVGSHWEARYMLGDYMISTDYFENVISDITLALFEDSGFYKVEYYSGGLFKFGKNAGCPFFEDKCLKSGKTNFVKDFCTNFDEEFCSRTRAFKGKCLIYKHSETIPGRYRYFDNSKYGGFLVANYCPVSNIEESRSDYYPSSCFVGESTLTDYGEVISESSFCFISSLLPSNSSMTVKEQAICYQVSCDKENKQIIVHYGENKITCPTNGGILSAPNGLKGSITCPEYNDICGMESDDDSICNEMFDCIHKKVETDADTFSYFPNEDDDFNAIRARSYSKNLKFNYYLLILLLICCIYIK